MSEISGIKETLAMLNNAKRSLAKGKIANACYEAASAGQSVAQTIYSLADYDGNRNVTVSPRKTSDGALLTARGPAVLFIEFGAGILYSSERHPYADELGMGAGTWPYPRYRKNSAGVRVANWENDKGWYFGNGFKTYGNPPAMAMYFAGKEIRERAVPLIRREIFGE